MRNWSIVLLPILVACNTNTTSPSGDNQTGFDFNDDVCAQARADLDQAIDETLSDVRASGMPSSAMPSRSDLEQQLGAGLRANGCEGF